MDDLELAKERVSPCGLHCGKCFAFRDGAIRKAALALQENLGNFEPYAQRFSTQLSPVFENYPAFKALLDFFAASDCGGCREEQCKLFKDCKVRPCAQRHQVDYCCECADFPCQETGWEGALYARFVDGNERIREIGPAAFYQEIRDLPRY